MGHPWKAQHGQQLLKVGNTVHGKCGGWVRMMQIGLDVHDGVPSQSHGHSDSVSDMHAIWKGIFFWSKLHATGGVDVCVRTVDACTSTECSKTGP